MTISCGTCINWTETHIGEFLEEDRIGECDTLGASIMVDIQVTAGYEGGYVSMVETDRKFFCAEYKQSC